jgi:zinc protease
MTIGAAEDIAAMEFDDVREFFRTYYHPTNASLVLAGDVDTADALERAEKYFGEIPPGVAPAPVRVEVSLTRESRLMLEDRIELPRLYAAWHTPAMFAAGDAEMDLAADILASGKSSRLYRTLVYDMRKAVDVSAYQGSREAGSSFIVAVTAAPGQSLADIAAVVDREIQQFVDDGPTDAEMQRSIAQAEAHFIYRLQTVGGFGGKSDQLNAYNVLLGDPGYFAADLERYRGATAARVRDAARRYLPFDARVLLAVVPRGEHALALPGSEPVVVS